MYKYYFHLFYKLSRLSTFFFSPESLLIAILFAIVNYYLLFLLEKPKLKRAFSEFSISKDHLKNCAIIFVTCYLLRAALLGLIGYYSLIVH